MSAAASLIPELELVLRRGSPERCAEMLAGITGLFLSGADRYNEQHVELFDAIFVRLIDDIETRARAELSISLAPVANAPHGTVRRLAGDDEIAVAAPMLQQSPCLTNDDLKQIASTKGQGHLLAISGRQQIGEAVTDVLVQRGDSTVVRTVAGNQTARFSDVGFSTLVDRANGDGVLAETVGLREDIPPRLFRTLLVQATAVVQQRLLAKARPETAAEIRRVLARVSKEIGAKAAPLRDYAQARATVAALRQQGKLGEPALVDFAKSGRIEETAVALAVLSGVPAEIVERLLIGDRPDPVLILGKAAGFGWPTVRALIQIRPGGRGTSTQALDAAYANFERLSPATAQSVTRFWQIRQGSDAA
jgi:uncharacterized protein (DUF2336 family)